MSLPWWRLAERNPAVEESVSFVSLLFYATVIMYKNNFYTTKAISSCGDMGERAGR